jgi:hypothetical protein
MNGANTYACYHYAADNCRDASGSDLDPDYIECLAWILGEFQKGLFAKPPVRSDLCDWHYDRTVKRDDVKHDNVKKA